MRNNRIIKSLILIMLLIAGTLTMSSCSTFDSFRHTFFKASKSDDADVIYIGVIESLTGKNAESGKDQVKGIELANKIYSNVNGHEVKLVEVDDKSSTSTAKTAIQELIKMNPTGIIGSAGDATSLIDSMYVGKAHIPTISPSATNPLITQNNGYYFIAGVTVSQEGAGMAEYACDELDSSSIGIVKIKNESVSDSFEESFKEKVKDLTDDKDVIKVETEISVEDTNMNKVVKAIKDASVDTVLVPIGAEKADSFFKSIEKNHLTNITFLGTDEWGSDEFHAILKKHPHIKVAFPYNSIDVDSARSDASITKEAKRFQVEYENEYGEDDEPTQDAALGYDSYLLMINAIYRANSTDGKDIRAALIELSGTHGATGVFEFDKNGNTIKSVNIATFRNNSIVPVYTTKSTTQAKTIQEIS